jgi:hypothetical protein
VDEAPVILGSAHRHGVRDEDLLHALRHHAETYDVGEGLTMVIGPDRTGVPMEVGVAERYGAGVRRARHVPGAAPVLEGVRTVPRSLDDILATADELADRFEAYEPEPGDRGTISPVTAVRLAALKRSQAERELADAVATARRGGTPWQVIGALVGTSGEAARQRYGKHAAG